MCRQFTGAKDVSESYLRQFVMVLEQTLFSITNIWTPVCYVQGTGTKVQVVAVVDAITELICAPRC